MKEKNIALLQKRIDRLQDNDFDLEAWKSGTKVALVKIFGEKSPIVAEIELLRIEFGSWSLRDSRASRDQNESCKRQGREILLAAIDELELSDEENGNVLSTEIKKVLEGQLTVAQYNELFPMLRSTSSKQLGEYLEKLGNAVVRDILVALLSKAQWW